MTIIGIAGGTGSGKTTVVRKIAEALPPHYVVVVPLDSYYNDTSAMTEEERTNPSILNGSRKNRISRGSGRSLVEINRLLKQFTDMQKMMRMVQKQGGKPPKMRRR